MDWKVTTWTFLGIITTWTLLDFVRYDTHPARWALWLTPLLGLGWVSYLHWKG